MNKIIVCFLLFGTLTLADYEDHPFGIMEKRIEKKFQSQNIIDDKEFEIDYDVDIYRNQMNFEIEIEGVKEPRLDIPKIVEKILVLTSNEAPDVTEVYIVISYEPDKGREKLLYSETHFLKNK